MSKISPCLWFDGKAEEAARFYVSLLPDSRIDAIMGPARRRRAVRPAASWRSSSRWLGRATSR